MSEPATRGQWIAIKIKQIGFWNVVIAIVGFTGLFVAQIFEEELGETAYSWLLIISSAATVVGFFATLAYLKLHIIEAKDQLTTSVNSNLEGRQESLRVLAGQFDEIVNSFRAITSPSGSEGRHLSVVAPIGQWLHTSSWDEIVKKMREMLKMHGWGQVPAYSSIRYLVSLKHIKPDEFGVEDDTLQNSTNFVRVNFLQTSGLDWTNFRYKDDDENEPLNRRAVLFDALKNALSTYVVMPFNDYSTTKKVSDYCSVVYPLSPQAIEKFSALYGKDRAETLKLLRRLPWKGPCDHAIFEEVTKTDGEFPKLLSDLTDNQRSIQLVAPSIADPSPNEKHAAETGESVEYAFSVNIVFQSEQSRHVEKIKYLSIFNNEGTIQESCLKHLPETDSGLDWRSVLCETENNIIGCYAPYAPDVERLRQKCSSIQSGEWKNIRIAFNWSYLHLQSMSVNGERYTNNSWSFQIYSVGTLERAEFRDDGENIRFENETAVIPYTMSPLYLLPSPTVNGGRSKVLFEGKYAFATSPSDVFHISWADPEVRRLEKQIDGLKEENGKLKKAKDSLETENDGLKEKHWKNASEKASLCAPAEVTDITASKRVS